MRTSQSVPRPLFQMVVFVALSLGGLPAGCFAASRELLALFRPGTLVLPSGSNGAPMEAVTISSSGIAGLFVVPADSAATPREFTLLAARHSRLGNALGAVGAPGGATTALTPGDTLIMEFATVAPVVGKERNWFLLLRGAYSSVPFASQPSPEHSEQPVAPVGFGLLGNRPNPLVERTTIHFALPATMPVRLEVFDLQGRLVRVLAAREYPAGVHVVEWDACRADGARVRPGVYLYRLLSGANRATGRMLVLAQG